MSAEISLLHGRAKEAFDRDPCVADSPAQLGDCARGRLASAGFEARDLAYLDANVDPAESPERARFLRVEAKYGESPDKHIFTFAILKSAGKYKLLWLQSAVATK
ncbi:MAG: hypothetical protein RXQ56_09790 [Thermoproteus sp.]|jgi:hypothetical protein|uniref:hypothetical protein n=1 Tax=Thermoproteus sp. CP80 TaxID=1650659 RepID=UPI0009C05BF2|nr:hypothetical protein [Thermoproteus sp. CP80]MCI4464656.1 hypothetical protein [Thermoproteus sp.]MDT7869252.1 hypothetical protein [Thermoproteus sp.]MDT7882231.1 hypothetical protein [Thermoproteus sp.]PLC65001.1 hypothetical protein B7L68_03695 [Thermoproteus sp. CP80]